VRHIGELTKNRSAAMKFPGAIFSFATPLPGRDGAPKRATGTIGLMCRIFEARGANRVAAGAAGAGTQAAIATRAASV
jgi:hypothetical protein